MPKLSEQKNEFSSLLELSKKPEFKKIVEKYEKKKEPKLSLLQRVGNLFSAFETGDPLYKSIYENKSFIKEYGKDIVKGVGSAITGKEYQQEPKKTYKDILVKQGMTDRPGKLDLVDIAGLAGDIGLDPSTYLGGVAGKGVIKGAGVGVKLAEKAPVAGKLIKGAKELFTPEIAKTTKALTEAGETGLARRFNYLITKMEKGTGNEINELLAGLKTTSKEYQRIIPKDKLLQVNDLIETGTKSGDEAMDKLADFLRQGYKDIKEFDLSKKTLNTELPDYVFHRATPEFLEKLGKSNLENMGVPKPIRIRLGAAKERKLKMPIKEANEWSMNKLGMKMFEEDPIKAFASRLIMSRRAGAVSDFFEQMKKGGFMVSGQKGDEMFMGGLKYVRSSVPQLKDAGLIAEPIKKHLDKVQTILSNNKEINSLVNFYDKALNVWKGSVYGWFLSSHTTNAVGGLFNNYLAGAVNPKLYYEAEKVLGKASGNVGKYSYNTIRKWLKDFGVIGESGYLDIPRNLDLQNASKLMAAGKLPRQFMGLIEDRLRVPLFIDGIKKGLSPADSAKRVIKYHFNYAPDGLSEFEKMAMKRVIPFYTFFRNNLPLTLEKMMVQPYKYQAIFKTQRATGTEPTSEEEKYLPTYLKNQLIAKTGEGKYLAGFKLPFEETLQKLGQPKSAISGSLSPFVKLPIELLTGQNLYRGKAIKEDTSGVMYKTMPDFIKKIMDYREIPVKDSKTGKLKYTKYTVNPTIKYMVENFPYTSRFFNTALRVSQGKEDPKNLLPIITAIKVYEIDPKEQKDIYQNKLLREMEALAERLGGGYQFKTFVMPKK